MLKVDFRILTISIPQMRDFVTHHYTKLPQKTPDLEQIVCFFGLIFRNTLNFAKLGALGLKRKPTHRYTNNDEKTILNL